MRKKVLVGGTKDESGWKETSDRKHIRLFSFGERTLAGKKQEPHLEKKLLGRREETRKVVVADWGSKESL